MPGEPLVEGSQGVATTPARVAEEDPQQQQITRLQQRISELERLTGKQAAELDFFAAASRSVQETRRKSGARSGEASTK